MNTTATISLIGYQAALEKAAYFIVPDAGYLKITGKDRVDFLHRQTTNDMGLLKEGLALKNVLTSPIARILDVLLLFEEPNGIGAITLPGYHEATTSFLKSKIFFMDQVEVQDASEDIKVIDLEGPQAAEIIDKMGLGNKLKLGHLDSLNVNGNQVRVIAQKGFIAELGYKLLVPRGSLDDLIKLLEKAGASKMDEDSYETLRVEAGIPQGGHELNQDFTPLETNLAEAVSDNKGCYTGQEVIARQITYDKISKQLVQLELEAGVEIGENVRIDGKKVGVVTSVAHSPRLGHIALGMIKKPHYADGTQIEIQGQKQSTAGIVKKISN